MRIGAVILLMFARLSCIHAQDPIVAYPNNYNLAFQNHAVTVIHVHYGPHEKLGVHDHSKFPTIYVYLNDSPPVRFEHFEEHAFTLTRPATTVGAFRVSPGRLEQHTVENLGSTSSDFLRVELKEIPLGRLKQSFRGAAPKNLSSSLDATEFKTPVVEIRRLICAGSAICYVDPSPAPSLIIAFTQIRGAMGENAESIEPGAVRWLNSSERLVATPRTASPVHLLRILIRPQNSRTVKFRSN